MLMHVSPILPFTLYSEYQQTALQFVAFGSLLFLCCAVLTILLIIDNLHLPEDMKTRVISDFEFNAIASKKHYYHI